MQKELKTSGAEASFNHVTPPSVDRYIRLDMYFCTITIIPSVEVAMRVQSATGRAATFDPEMNSALTVT